MDASSSSLGKHMDTFISLSAVVDVLSASIGEHIDGSLLVSAIVDYPE